MSELYVVGANGYDGSKERWWINGRIVEIRPTLLRRPGEEQRERSPLKRHSVMTVQERKFS